MNQQEIIELLKTNGFDGGWVLAGTELVIWEHEVDPPAPLTKPEA